MAENFYPPEELQLAQQAVTRFVERHKPSYRLLLYHAALPLVLTPELLNYLRTKFLQAEVPWVAEADLLLSELCRQVGYEQYVMEPAVRAYLLQEMKRDPTLGQARMEAVARLLIHYVQHLARTDTFAQSHELQAQQWAAMVYIEEQRETAIQEIATALKNTVTAVLEGAATIQSIVNQAEMACLANLTQELAPGLERYPELVKYAANVTQFLLTPTNKSIGEIRELLQIDLDADLHLPPVENADISLSYSVNEKDVLPSPERIRETWLRRLGFKYDPFSHVYGERDPNLIECFSLTSSFHNIFHALSTPVTHLVFGEEGSGKTSLRNVIAEQVHLTRDLAVVYSDFQALIEKAKQKELVQLEDHVDRMLEVAVVALETEFEDEMSTRESTFADGNDSYDSLLSAYIKRYGPNLTVRKTSLNASRLNTNVVQELPQDPYERLSTFFECVRGLLRYENVYFLIDPVNDTAEETATIWLVLQPLLSDFFLQKLSQDKAALIFFLNSRFRDLALTIDWINHRQTTSISVLEWSEESLRALLASRLKSSSGVKPSYDSLRWLSDNVENLDDMVIQEAGKNPRNLIALCSAIFDAHCQKPITEDNLLITREEVAEALSRQGMLFSPSISPPVLFSTWKMRILVRSCTASNTEWVEECEMPPAHLFMPDEEIGICPVGLNHTQIELWARSFRMPELICYLDLSDHSLFDSNLGHLAVFTHLKELNLGKTLISGEGLAALKDLPLTWLRLDACKNLSDRGLQSTGALVHLDTLDVSRCTGITGRGLSHPQPLAHLRVLNLEGCSTLQEEALAALAAMPALEDLDLSETQISGTGFLHFRNNHTLRTLSLEGCARFKSQTVPHLLNLEALEILRLGRTSIEDADLEQLQVLRNLRELHLYGCAKVTADKVAKLKARGLRVFHDSSTVIVE